MTKGPYRVVSWERNRDDRLWLVKLRESVLSVDPHRGKMMALCTDLNDAYRAGYRAGKKAGAQ